MNDPFVEFALILLIAAGMGGLAVLLRQPLLVAFIVVGMVVGPAGLKIVRTSDQLEVLASLGIAVLLFLVGLRLDVSVIKSMGSVALATGLGQVAFTSAIGFLLCMWLGMDAITSAYVAIALTFSSTIIIVKLLSDKREIDALHGRIAVGFLIVQDLVVVLMLIGLSAFGRTPTAQQHTPIAETLVILVKGLGLLAALAVLMRYVLPFVAHHMAKHQELLMVFGVAWAAAVAAFTDYAGFNREIGAFLAGVSLASTPFRDALGGRLVSVRDFLLLFFFIHLGSTLNLEQLGENFWSALALSLFVLIGNPIIVMIIMGAMGYRKRTSFLAGLTVAQISEFSLILGAMGVSMGHIQSDALNLITLVGIITIGLSTYMIVYSHQLYELMSPILSIFERKVAYREAGVSDSVIKQADVIVFGLGRFGEGIVHSIEQHGLRVMGVDFDPQVVRKFCKQGQCAQYGDAEDPEFAASLPLNSEQGGARWVIGTMPQLHVNRALVNSLREQRYAGRIAVTAHSYHDARLLQKLKVDLVLLPFVDAAREAAERILGFDERQAADQSATVSSPPRPDLLAGTHRHD